MQCCFSWALNYLFYLCFYCKFFISHLNQIFFFLHLFQFIIFIVIWNKIPQPFWGCSAYLFFFNIKIRFFSVYTQEFALKYLKKANTNAQNIKTKRHAYLDLAVNILLFLSVDLQPVHLSNLFSTFSKIGRKKKN